MKKYFLKRTCLCFVLMLSFGFFTVTVFAEEASVIEDNPVTSDVSEASGNVITREMLPGDTATDKDNATDSVATTIKTASLFLPRLTAPGTDNSYFYANNIFYQSGYGMPNCTAYAWGRAYELLGSKPNLSTGNANQWWDYNLSKGIYSSGNTPKLGAIVCWNGSTCGHVAVVEAISGNQVTISESAWSGFLFRNYSYPIGSEDSSSVGGFQGYIYLGDFDDTPPIVNPPTDTTPPTVSNIQITDVNGEGFTVTCNVSDDSGIDRVMFPAWTEAGGQDDLVWQNGTVNGNTASCRILYSDHGNQRGDYIVHVYAYDKNGLCTTVPTGTTIDSTPPTITDVEVLNVSSLGYTVKCKVSDDSGIDRVQFPTWTNANGQDDVGLTWYSSMTTSSAIEGDIVSYTVRDWDHNCERGEYSTHIYGYDKFGNVTCYPVSVDVENDGSIIKKEVLNGHKYLLFNDALTWPEAEKEAEALGGNLVTITSLEEQALVKSMVSNAGRDNYFIGGTDQGQEGNYRWVTGEPFGITKWLPGQPDNNNGNENYLEISKTGYWNDVSDTRIGGYIVEKDLGAINIDSFSADKDSGQYANTSINLTAQASGENPPYQYKFYDQLGNTTTVLQDYSESNTVNFKPSEAGIYTLSVDVKDAEGQIVTKSIANYNIQKMISCSYQTHIENFGWQDYVSNGNLSGTVEQALRLEAIKINLDNQGYNVGIDYSTHIENIGWQDYVSNGNLSGTVGQALRLEAIKIKLSGADAEKFDVYYRVHAENVGWMGWAKNGEPAGTAGFCYRLEAIEIQIVPRGEDAPGTTATPFIANV
ncbi:CHAP domain-containing protein [Acetobacterium paludosum]|uniref:CHAP domain-containing protein n=1 Tax=Acetobacterium paludosum TaxID=52693 RepID=A0A923KVB0_9FIRM|nr:GBS Bsp-like repeat-containing protein [Acetobacterium paludosum]MBC3887300.1 CHAP domain-containing protein [Acetobacterium paludosum]